MGHSAVVARLLKSLAAARGGVTVTLRRGGFETSDVSATVSTTVAQVEQRDQTYLRVESRDYIILSAEYRIDGLACDPKPGDLIEELVEGKLLRCKVVPFGGGPCFEPMESTRTAWRIHTELIDEFVPGQLRSEDGRPLFSEDGAPIMAEDSEESG